MITPKFEYFPIFSTFFCEKQRYFDPDFLGLKHYYSISAQLAYKMSYDQIKTRY